METLGRLRVLDSFVHRHALGSAEFDSYLSWRRGPLKTYGTIYLAFHGTRRGLCVGDDDYALSDIATLIGDLPDGVVHLGSCSVLLGNESAAEDFLARTGARVVSGYERDVQWLDTAWLGYAASYSRLGDAVRHFRTRYASVIDHLGWRAHGRGGM